MFKCMFVFHPINVFFVPICAISRISNNMYTYFLTMMFLDTTFA